MASTSTPPPELTDLDKLLHAFSTITSITSPNDILAAFGLLDLPIAQKYGIVFGCLTFTITVIAVLTLLYFGGSFQRIQEQAKSGELVTAPDSVTQRKRRPLLLERLLEGREWMMQTNYNGGTAKLVATNEQFTNLTKMLMTDAPKDKSSMSKEYEENYIKAYKRCQDKPGGAILGGRPNHRFEAYARAYAGCGSHTSLKYRWSYARMYESMAGKSHESEERFQKLYKERPHDIIGKTCRLEPLLGSRHCQELWEITSGNACNEHKAYNADEVWGFLDCGPFKNVQEMQDSEVFNLEYNAAGFAIVEFVTDRLVGVVHLSHDDPKNLSVQLDLPIVKPSSDGSIEQLEACFLLLDRLFAYGYRHIQICVDALDVRGKRLPQRLGFTQEGQIPKHMIVKEANRDSIIYGMLNSDWDKGARSFLLKKLHGAAFEKADRTIVAKEEAVEEEAQQLKEKQEAEEAKANKKKK
jgi:RimJ/RimL family protein N-acetyltransferase